MQRALGNGWEIDLVKRPGSQAQSVLGRVVFNHILGLPDGAFSLNMPVRQIVDRQIARRLGEVTGSTGPQNPAPST